MAATRGTKWLIELVNHCKANIVKLILAYNTKSLIILSTASVENRSVLVLWICNFNFSSNLTLFACTHWRIFRGGRRVPSIIGVGRQWDWLPNICGICKHVEQVVLCLPFLLGELRALPNPLARFKWAARRGGESNVERGRGRGRGRKGRDRKMRSGLSPSKNRKGTHASIYY